MGIVTTEREQVLAVAPAIIYKAMILDFSNVLPKALPNLVKSIEVEGDGGPGSFKKVTTSVYGYLKQRVDLADAENYAYSYTLIEGGVLLEEPILEKVSYEYKLVPNPNGGTILKCTSKFYTKGDAQLSQDLIKANNETSAGVLKAVVDYLLANPDYYN